ncbi:MAG: hypothetical protein HKN87_23275 [Saprospiraceae bacterium]|nr:hypothetical protein [Saprospiraceae bacterium]
MLRITLLMALISGIPMIMEVKAQNLQSIGPGAPASAMGGISSIHQDVLAMYGNEAGLAFIENTVGYATAEKRFASEGLNYYSLVGAHPLRSGVIGFTAQYFGFEAFNEFLFGLAYGRKIAAHLSLGVQFDYLQVRIPGYGMKQAYLVELGLLSEIGEKVRMGFHIYNPFEIRWVEQEVLPIAVQVGLWYEVSDKVITMAEVEKVTNHPANLKVGLQYQVAPTVALRLGINTNPSTISFGVGYSIDSGMRVDVSSSVHQHLGLTPIGGVGYEIQD